MAAAKMKTRQTTFIFLLLTILNSCELMTDKQSKKSDFDVTQIKVDPKIDYENTIDSTSNRGGAVQMIWQKQYDIAISLLFTELKINPQNVYAIHLIGLAYNESGRSEQALPYFNKAIEMIPNECTFHFNRGLAYYRLYQPQKAIDDYSIAIKFNSQDSSSF